MSKSYDEIMKIVDRGISPDLKLIAIKSFAEELRLTPSYDFKASFGVDAVEDHLVVEHGLESSAIISFLKSPDCARDLTADNLKSLLKISYNNLIEWHIFVSQTDIRQVNNLVSRRTSNISDMIYQMTPEECSARLSVEEFDRLFSLSRYKKDLQSCDDALMSVLSKWKRLLKSDYHSITNENISALFNAIIFVRGCEDRNFSKDRGYGRAILSNISKIDEEFVNIAEVLDVTLSQLGINQQLYEYVNFERLQSFSQMDKATANNLCRDFYSPKEAAYEFNFALMSKHALSRIYERYVSLLRPEIDKNLGQLQFFSPIPIEQSPEKTGAIYTPQFISSFFSRYIRENTTPRKFRELKIIDPACGSGLFLRNMLELQCNPTMYSTTTQHIEQAFEQVVGIDRDPNACEATRLSLALLHLVATGRLPTDLKILEKDAIREAVRGNIELQSYGAILTNPPYVKYDHLSNDERELYKTYLGPSYIGRFDAYIPFLKLCLDAVEPTGFICMVLPQTFLTAANAAAIRKQISQKFDVRCLVDLSSVNVFNGVGAYSILLIVQKRQNNNSEVLAQIAQIADFAGSALQACINGATLNSPHHQVFNVPQSYFQSDNWSVVDEVDISIIRRFKNYPTLSDYFNVMQGFVTGADDVFIIDKRAVPSSEAEIYLQYAQDRKILRYGSEVECDRVVFYPYHRGALLTESFLRERYPKTYVYLRENRTKLEARGPVRANKTPWWKPERPREPSKMMRRKIICPHLMLTPRFALDLQGNVAVSRSPYLVARNQAEENMVLKLYLAVINSSFSNWYMRVHAPKYAHSYNRIEANFLKGVPVPDITKINARDLKVLLSLVDQAILEPDSRNINIDIDDMVANFYGFTKTEKLEMLGIGL